MLSAAGAKQLARPHARKHVPAYGVCYRYVAIRGMRVPRATGQESDLQLISCREEESGDFVFSFGSREEAEALAQEQKLREEQMAEDQQANSDADAATGGAEGGSPGSATKSEDPESSAIEQPQAGAGESEPEGTTVAKEEDGAEPAEDEGAAPVAEPKGEEAAPLAEPKEEDAATVAEPQEEEVPAGTQEEAVQEPMKEPVAPEPEGPSNSLQGEAQQELRTSLKQPVADAAEVGAGTVGVTMSMAATGAAAATMQLPVAVEAPAHEPMQEHSSSQVGETSADEDWPDLASLKVRDLKALCKEHGLKGYAKLRKEQLLELLDQAVCGVNPETNAPEPCTLENLTVSQLRGIAKERGMVGYTGLRKQELVHLLLQVPVPDEE